MVYVHDLISNNFVADDAFGETLVKLPKRCGVMKSNNIKLALFNKAKETRLGSKPLLPKGVSGMEVYLDSSKPGPVLAGRSELRTLIPEVSLRGLLSQDL